MVARFWQHQKWSYCSCMHCLDYTQATQAILRLLKLSTEALMARLSKKSSKANCSCKPTIGCLLAVLSCTFQLYSSWKKFAYYFSLSSEQSLRRKWHAKPATFHSASFYICVCAKSTDSWLWECFPSSEVCLRVHRSAPITCALAIAHYNATCATVAPFRDL